MKRCLNGKTVAWSRSNEMTARLMRDTIGKKLNGALRRFDQFKISQSFFYSSKYFAILRSIYRGPEIAPAKRSTIARWMTKYVLRRCSWLCFTNTIIVMILRMIMARHSVLNTTSHGIHCDTGNSIQSSWLVLFSVLLLVLVVIEFGLIFVTPNDLQWRETSYLVEDLNG